MSRKNRKTGTPKRRHKLLTSPTPELVAALSLLGASLRVTEVPAAEEPSTLSSGSRLAQVTIKEDTQKSQTNTMKERKLQNNAVKTNNTYKPDTRTLQNNAVKTTNTYKPDTQLQSTSDKWQPPKVQNNQNLKK